jgi:hypothetical protein
MPAQQPVWVSLRQSSEKRSSVPVQFSVPYIVAVPSRQPQQWLLIARHLHFLHEVAAAMFEPLFDLGIAPYREALTAHQIEMRILRVGIGSAQQQRRFDLAEAAPEHTLATPK